MIKVIFLFLSFTGIFPAFAEVDTSDVQFLTDEEDAFDQNPEACEPQ
jgi:hypothetical protein